MEIKHGQKAKIIGFEVEGSHEFNIGDVVTFIGISEDDETWYTFKDDNGKVQDLVFVEFELV